MMPLIYPAICVFIFSFFAPLIIAGVMKLSGDKRSFWEISNKV